MKKIIVLSISALLMFSVFACSSTAAVSETPKEAVSVQSGEAETVQNTDAKEAGTEEYGSAGAAQNENLTLEEMLTYAIQDEYMAYAEYDAILAEYGDVAPFSNIIKAEESHISQLLPLFDANGFDVPVDDAASRIVFPASLQEAYQAGVDAEIANISMYESFLAEALPADVQAVFENLMSASKSHLSAFENALSGNAGSGGGQGQGAGNGSGSGLRDGSGKAAS